MMYLCHIFGVELDMYRVAGQLPAHGDPGVLMGAEVVEQPLWKYLFESTDKPGWVAGRKL